MSALTMRSAVAAASAATAGARVGGAGHRRATQGSPRRVDRAEPRSRRATVRTEAAFVSSGVTTSDLKEAGGRVVVELGGGKILIQEFMDDVYAVSNKCPHLGLSMQGKTALLSAEMRDDGCIVCPAHKSAFKLDTGEPQGEWCPGLPTLPVVGKPLEGEPAPLPVYEVRVTEGGTIEIDLDGTTGAGTDADGADPAASFSDGADPAASFAEDIGKLRGSELAALRQLPLADAVKGSENVVGAEGIRSSSSRRSGGRSPCEGTAWDRTWRRPWSPPRRWWRDSGGHPRVARVDVRGAAPDSHRVLGLSAARSSGGRSSPLARRACR